MSQIKNFKKAAKRIKQAIKEQENIVLFSDSDLDGVASLLILEETIKSLGGKISLRYFPDRRNQGYGLSQTALKAFEKHGPGLLILSDCGASSFQAIDQAKQFGLETIIIDHHELTEQAPDNLIIIDPKQPGDRHAFKGLAACGLCFKLARALFKKMPQSLEKSFLELVALATIADKMPQQDENKEFIEKGLSYLASTGRPGLKAYFNILPFSQYSLEEIVKKMSSTLQITEMQDHLTESYVLLSSINQDRADKLLEKLIEEASQRQEMIRDFSAEIEEKISESGLFIFQGGEYLPFSLTGGLAGRLCARTNKTAFIYALKKDIARGSVRSTPDINSVQALKACSRYLDVFGGHAPAAGFTCKIENLENFKKCLEKYFNNQ